MEGSQRLDFTTFNRKERRKLSKRVKIRIPGRYLPYQKALHGSIGNFYSLREKEIAEQAQENNKK